MGDEFHCRAYLLMRKFDEERRSYNLVGGRVGGKCRRGSVRGGELVRGRRGEIAGSCL